MGINLTMLYYKAHSKEQRKRRKPNTNQHASLLYGYETILKTGNGKFSLVKEIYGKRVENSSSLFLSVPVGTHWRKR